MIVQGRSIYVNRVSSANTLRKCTIKSHLSYFRGSLVVHTLERRGTDQIKCTFSQLYPGVVSRFLRLNLGAGVCYRVAVYGVPLNHESKTEDFFFKC
jgi:hypothetical protein